MFHCPLSPTQSTSWEVEAQQHSAASHSASGLPAMGVTALVVPWDLEQPARTKVHCCCSKEQHRCWLLLGEVAGLPCSSAAAAVPSSRH